MGTCGSVKHRRLLVLHFVLKYKKKRHTNGLRTMAPLTSELTAYIHDHNPLRCNMCYNKEVRFHPFYPLIFNPTDGNRWQQFSKLPEPHMCLMPQLPANNYHKLSAGHGGWIKFSVLCCTDMTRSHEWWITDFSSTPAVFFVLVSIFQRTSAGENGTQKDN